MALEQRDALIHAADWGLCVIYLHGLAHLGAITWLGNLRDLLVIAIGVQPDGPIEILLVCMVHLHVVLGSHHVVVVLPVLDHLEVVLDLHRLLHRLADFLNDPTLVHKISLLLLILVDGFNG